MKFDFDENGLKKHLDMWVKNDEKANPEIIAIVAELEGQENIDKPTQYNLIVARHKISSEAFLQKMDESFNKILNYLQWAEAGHK
jgi:hypothetical protein